MADDKTTGISTRTDGTWEMDAAAFVPEPNGYLKVKGEEYPIYSFLDIPSIDSIRAVKLNERIEATKDFNERMALSIEHLCLLSAGPADGRGNRKSLSATNLDGVTPRQIIGLVVMANTIAVRPPEAETSENQTQSV